MKFFYWNLTAREKFVRSLWGGCGALLLLYGAAYTYEGDPFIKFYVPILVTVCMLLSFVYKYYKMKKSDVNK